MSTSTKSVDDLRMRVTCQFLTVALLGGAEWNVTAKWTYTNAAN